MAPEAWPEAAEARDMAALCLRLVRRQRPLSPFVDRGRMVFVTDTPEMFATVLEERAEVYARPAHPYRDLLPLYDDAGSFALGLDRAPGAGREAGASIRRTIARETADAARELAARCGRGAPVTLLAAAREVTLRSVTRILFGVDASPWAEAFVRAAGVVEAWQVMVTRPHGHPALADALAAMEVRYRAADRILAASTAPLPPPAGPFHPRRAVIETLMNAFNGLATALAWTLLELARRPEVLAAVRAEVDGAAEGGAEGRTAPALPFTIQVVKETLRLHPVAWAVGRRAAREDRLGGHDVPAGAAVVCCIYALHRNPAHWAQPEAFRPERFAPGSAARHRLAYLPFGAGALACPAGHLVPLMLVSLLAALLRGHQVEVDAPERVGSRTLVSLHPHPDPAVRIAPREPDPPSAARPAAAGRQSA
jgi:cytochrome P450